jgi:hypothetical protein
VIQCDVTEFAILGGWYHGVTVRLCSVLVLFVLHIVAYCMSVGGWCAKSPQFSCLLRRFSKLDGLTEEDKCDTV